MTRFLQISFVVVCVVIITALVAWRFDATRKEISLGLPTPTRRPFNPSPTPIPVTPESYSLKGGTYSGQTFNNCGPASLSMALSFHDKNVSQAELASKLRPFNNPLGGVDDKAVLAYELVNESKNQGLESMERPNGTPEMLRRLLSQDVSVILRTWLNPSEDIGHYRVLTGYDKGLGVFYANDSYHGPNIILEEKSMVEMWQPFNYGYIVIYPKDKEQVVRGILGEDLDEKTAWQNSLRRADTELKENPNHPYANFNKSVAYFYLGRYDESVIEYEKAVGGLPPRMLWYQLEPIYAYQKTGQYEKALLLIDRILFSGNLAYSELYQVKGEIYLSEGDTERAREEFEKAVMYNENFLPAKEALQRL